MSGLSSVWGTMNEADNNSAQCHLESSVKKTSSKGNALSMSVWEGQEVGKRFHELYWNWKYKTVILTKVPSRLTKAKVNISFRTEALK